MTKICIAFERRAPIDVGTRAILVRGRSLAGRIRARVACAPAQVYARRARKLKEFARESMRL